MVDHTDIIRGLLSSITALDGLPHPRPAGRLLLAVALAGKGANDDAVAGLASMPVAGARDVIPTMLLGVSMSPPSSLPTRSGIRITADGQRHLINMRDHLIGG